MTTQVQDRGGNLVSTDSSSKILVQLVDNPLFARVLPDEQTFMPVVSGSVNFTLLNVDQAGSDFQLIFWLYSYDWRTNVYSKTSIRTYSEVFAVQKGGVAALFLDPAFAISEKWAGGQPFQVPPMLRLVVSPSPLSTTLITPLCCVYIYLCPSLAHTNNRTVLGLP